MCINFGFLSSLWNRKIFIGGLAKETTLERFVKYFEKYGEVIDSVIMKDRNTGRPRGFGFITYVDPSVVDTVIVETHNINDKQVEIKRTIPKGSVESKNFRTKKVTDYEIIRGFGFIEYDEEQVVENLLSQGNMIDMLGNQVEIKKAEPKKPSHPASIWSCIWQ
ncbi:hypothetical protein KY284_011372 [Solanum tuberosum]|nr:hypothetical protein KY284_011372 [Solanum tuberosum]